MSSAPTHNQLQHRTRVKICGLTREQDVDAAVEAGADAVGFVLYDRSPRFVTPQRAAELQNRPSVSGRIVRRDPATGAIIAIGRFVRELVGGRYVTRWEDLPA